MAEWTYQGKEVLSIDDMPPKAFGFVYEVNFHDGSRYVGKKQLMLTSLKLPLPSGNERKNHIEWRIKRRNGHLTQYELVWKESDWRTYQGSCKDCNKPVLKKEILEYAFSKSELTYLEARWLFIKDVLRKDEYMNGNIDGRYYKGRV